MWKIVEIVDRKSALFHKNLRTFAKSQNTVHAVLRPRTLRTTAYLFHRVALLQVAQLGDGYDRV